VAESFAIVITVAGRVTEKAHKKAVSGSNGAQNDPSASSTARVKAGGGERRIEGYRTEIANRKPTRKKRVRTRTESPGIGF
jgi:hypothetical protein